MSSASVGERRTPQTAPGASSSPSDSRRSEFQSCLREAAVLPGVDAATCHWLEEKLACEVFNLVVAGEFKRGKSSLINALLGEALLPVGVVPLTSVVTVIRSGPTPTACVELKSGERLTVDPSALAEYVTERGNPGNAKNVERVLIDHSSPWLAHGVRLVDTPGIGSVYEHNTDETCRYLPQADAVLFVASVDQPLSRAELDFLRDVRSYAGKTFCLLNKIDYLRPEELRESLEFSTAAVREALGASVPVFPVSARLALEGRHGSSGDVMARSGFRELEQALRNFMEREKTNAWLRSIARSLGRLLSQARFTLDLESKVLTEPLERIEANLAAYLEEKSEAERARADYRVLLEADARRLLKESVEPKLEAFKQEQRATLDGRIEQWYAELRELPPRKLQVALEERTIAHVRAAYDGWLAREDVELSRAFEQLCARFWSSLQESVDELMRRSSELFAVDFESARADARWTAVSGFYYKFWYEPTSLRLLSSSTVLVLPKLLAGRLIVKRAKASGSELTDVQAGRIRHDLEERLKKSVQDAQRQMLRQIETTIAGIDSAIDHGISTRRRSAEHASARHQELARLRQRIKSLDARVTAVLDAVSGP